MHDICPGYPQGTTVLIITLLLIVIASGSASAAVIGLAGFGWVACAAAYVVGGMIGTAGFLTLQLRASAPAVRVKPIAVTTASHPLDSVQAHPAR